MSNIDIKITKGRGCDLWKLRLDVGTGIHEFLLYHSEMRELLNQIPKHFKELPQND